MKVLFLSPTGAIGGAERVLLSAIAAVRQGRPEVHCHLLSLSSGPLLESAAALGAHTIVLPAPVGLQGLGDSQAHAGNRVRRVATLMWHGLWSSWRTWRYSRRLRRQIDEIAPDLIHSNGVKTHLLLWLARVYNVPMLWHVHDFLSRRPLARKMLKLASRRATGAIAISHAVAEDLRRLWPRLPVHVVANAVDTHDFRPEPGDVTLLDRLAGMPPQSCLRVGLVATFARWKGHDVFLDAAARILRTRPDLPVRFYVIGGPIYQTRGSQFDLAELQLLCEKFAIRSEVGFIDFQPDIRPIYRALDVVVHASTAPEPFGLTIIEAMACGKAVVAVADGGSAEIFRSGFDALGVPPGDAAALANAIATLLASAEMRDSIGGNARQTICERFSLERFRKELGQLYDQFLRKAAAQGGNHPNPHNLILHAKSN